MKNSCINCMHFKSFRDDCFGDLMEPDDQGYCLNGDSEYYRNEGAGYDTTCEKHEPINT